MAQAGGKGAGPVGAALAGVFGANGHVLAGSLGIALACDLIIAKDSAGFGTPEINVGLFPFMIMALIYRNVGRKKTTEMLLLGERMTAAEAREAGIVVTNTPGVLTDAVGFSLLARPVRRRMIETLASGGAATATILARGLPITRQGIAKHLALLAEAPLGLRPLALLHGLDAAYEVAGAVERFR